MLLPQTHSPAVDYSLFIMETVEMSMEMSMEKVEASPAGLRQSFPPPIFSLLISVFWFFSCGGSLLKKHQGTSYIGVFRSRGCFWAKDRCKQGYEGQVGWAHASRYRGRVGPPLWSSGLRSLTSFASRSSSFQNNDTRKFISHYDDVKVLK